MSLQLSFQFHIIFCSLSWSKAWLFDAAETQDAGVNMCTHPCLRKTNTLSLIPLWQCPPVSVSHVPWRGTALATPHVSPNMSLGDAPPHVLALTDFHRPASSLWRVYLSISGSRNRLTQHLLIKISATQGNLLLTFIPLDQAGLLGRVPQGRRDIAGTVRRQCVTTFRPQIATS